jgi:replicative DNA helicase
MENRPEPHDLNAERLVLGTILGSSSALHEVRELLTPDTFHDRRHADVYRAVLAIDERGESPDLVAVYNELRKRNSDFQVQQLAELGTNWARDVYQHTALLHDKKVRRNLIGIARKLEHAAFDEGVDIVDIQADTEEKIKGIFSGSDNSVSTIGDAIRGVYSQIDRNHAPEKYQTGTLTGFREFDRRSGGLQQSDLVIIAAETSQGKTSLAVCIGMNAALSGCPVAFYSLEMKKEQIAARMLSIQSGVPANQILYSGNLHQDQFQRIDRGVSSLYDRKIYFDDRSTSNIDTIINSIRNLHKKYGIRGAIVDYLQILNVNMKGSSPEQQMGHVARRLKNLAKELDLWIIALSQLSRDHANPMPNLNRLRDSGQIGEAADIVMLIYRPEVYNRSYPEPFRNASTANTALIDVAKGRNIGLVRFICGFDKHTTRFYEASDIQINEKQAEEEPF